MLIPKAVGIHKTDLNLYAMDPLGKSNPSQCSQNEFNLDQQSKSN